MSTVDTQTLKSLRDETGAGIMDIKRALEEAAGDVNKARELIKARGLERAAKKEGNETKEGWIGSYVHTNGKVAAMVALTCETDFVARNPEFQALARELAMHAASMKPESVDELLEQENIRTGDLNGDLVKTLAGKVGENIKVSHLGIVMI